MRKKYRIIKKRATLNTYQYMVQKKFLGFWSYMKYTTVIHHSFCEFVHTFKTEKEAREFIIKQFVSREKEKKEIVVVGNKKEDFIIEEN